MPQESVRSEVDPYKLLRLLEDFTDTHARTVRALNRTLNRLRRDIYNEELQSLAFTYLKRLRVLRKRLWSFMEGRIILNNVEAEIRDAISTLSEYVVIVGSIYEEEVLKKALILARKGATLLMSDVRNIEKDLDDLHELTRKFQEIVDKYY